MRKCAMLRPGSDDDSNDDVDVNDNSRNSAPGYRIV